MEAKVDRILLKTNFYLLSVSSETHRSAENTTRDVASESLARVGLGQGQVGSRVERRSALM